MTDPVGYSIPLWAVFCRECKDEEAPDDADAVPIDHADAAREGGRFMVCECCERVYNGESGEWEEVGMRDARGEYNARYRFIHAWDGANAGWRTVEIRVYENGHVVPVTGPEHYNANESAALAAMQRIYLRSADALWGDD